MKRIIFTLLLTLLAATWGQNTVQPPFTGQEGYADYDTIIATDKVDGYTFERWVNREAYKDGDSFFAGTALRIISPTGQHYDMDNASLDWELDDLTNDGIAEVIISSFSGGAHCCTTSVVLELQSGNINELFRLDNSECGIHAKDVDGDGTKEILSCDDTWAYAYCAYAFSPLPTMVWAWDGAQFSVANLNPDYQEVFTSDVAMGMDILLDRLQADEFWASECTALWLALPYLYEGKQEHARAAIDFFYSHVPNTQDEHQFTDSASFWQSILETAESSELYQAVLQSESQ